jgi:cell wall-associated NlpC family hydrolase
MSKQTGPILIQGVFLHADYAEWLNPNVCKKMALPDRLRNRWLIASMMTLTVFLLGGCGGTSHLRSPDVSADQQRPLSGARHRVVKTAAQQIGTPYRYGGNSTKGFDCSGLVQYTHRQSGIDVPRTTALQWKHAAEPRRRHLLPGDLVFFKIGWGKGRHVGIYEGDGVFIHAPSSGKRVSRASLDNPYWRKRMIGARTFL